MTQRPATSVVAGERVSHEHGKSDWFLRESAWRDDVWLFAPTNALDEVEPFSIRWDFELSSGLRFTDPGYAALLESAKKFVALVRTRSLASGLAQRSGTVEVHFCHLRELVRWMDREGFARFADLDATAILQFQHSLRSRTNSSGSALAPRTIQGYLITLVYLHRYRGDLGDGLRVDPCPGQSTGIAAGEHVAGRRSWPYTPDAVAVPLIKGAIEFLENGALDVLRAREIYARAIEKARKRGFCKDACNQAAVRALRQLQPTATREPIAINSISELARVVDMLYAACFVVLSYLVGPRASEILHLQAGCLRPLSPGGGEGLAIIVGSIFKREVDYHGRTHEWVAPPPVSHAICVLEALSAPHRTQTGSNKLWLRARGRTHGATEWQFERAGRLQIAKSQNIRELLNRFSNWLRLPHHNGEPWRLSTHQGRKTFARFAALRDRSSLFALAQHFGHRERTITDQGYAGNDYALDREISAEILEQSVQAWEHMLSAPGLGGRAGAEIVAKRPHFRGERMKQDLNRYARMLVDAGLTLGICEWGFCVYREEYSACLGNAAGPNPVRREPSTCARCKNFAVSTEHRPYWVDQARRHEALLNEPALPTQTLKIARERLGEALVLIRSIDTNAKGNGHANQAARKEIC